MVIIYNYSTFSLFQLSWPSKKYSLVTSRGLKARGHPLGATGVAQVVELVWQLRGDAGKRQVEEAKTRITCNFGGFGNNIISMLVERM